MTTINRLVKKCMHCGALNRCDEITSTSSFGLPDLDTRPAPLARQAIEFGAHRCTHCNYASENLERKIIFDDSILTSENYIKVLKSDYPELAKNYILASMIRESIGNYNDAALFMLQACWVLDDKDIDAKKTRIVAAKLFEKTEGMETARLIIIDLYRRAEEYDAAKMMINKSREFISDPFMKDVLKCEEVLVDIYDSECHSCDDIEKFIGESELEDEEDGEADSMEEVTRKLFTDDCNEDIKLYSASGKLVSFQQIALIPIDDQGKREVYAILMPRDDHAEDDEVLVFQLIGEDCLEELRLVKDDDLIDVIFDEYYKLVAAGNE